MNALPPANRPPVRPGPPLGAPAAAPPRQIVDHLAQIKYEVPKLPPRLFIYGVEKIGKTTAGLSMPAPLFLCAEDGLVGEDPRIATQPHLAPKTWNDLLETLDQLATREHAFKSVVIDTADWTEAKTIDHCCARDKKENIEAYGGFGKGERAIGDEFRRLTNRLDRLRMKGIASLILAHAQVKTFKSPGTEDYDRWEPKCVSKHVSGMLREWADAVLFAHTEVYIDKASPKARAKGIGGQNRVVHTNHNAAWDAGNRYSLPEVMPFDMDVILDAIMNRDNATYAGDTTAEMVGEIEELLPTLPDTAQTKIRAALTNAGEDANAVARILNGVRSAVARFNPETSEEST
jgi:hypothetical protein